MTTIIDVALGFIVGWIIAGAMIVGSCWLINKMDKSGSIKKSDVDTESDSSQLSV